MRIISVIRFIATGLAWAYFTALLSDPATPAIKIVAEITLLFIYASAGLSFLRFAIETGAFRKRD